MSLNGQQRKSIDDFKKRVTDQGGAIHALETVYAQMEPSQQTITPALFAGHVIEYVPGFPTVRNPCNMDPTSYSLPVVDCVVRLFCHFNLSIPEVYSVQMAFQILPNTTIFFGIASQMLLNIPPSKIPSSCRSRFGFGHLLANLIVNLFRTFRESGSQQNFRRFNYYKEPSVPSRQKWEEICHDTTSYCLHVLAAYSGPAMDKVREDQYRKISRELSELWEGAGILVTSHSINQKACLGLLPAWCRDYAITDPTSRVVQYFNDEFELKKKLNATELRRFMKTLAQRFQVAFERTFTKRVLENILCKVYRVLNNPKTNKSVKEKWCDTLQQGQVLFNFRPNSIQITFSDGSSEIIEGDAAITRFPYGDSLLPMAEIVIQLGLPLTMPSNSRTRQFQFYDRIWFPRVDIDVDFDMPPLPILSLDAQTYTRQVLWEVLQEPVPRHNAKRTRRNA